MLKYGKDTGLPETYRITLAISVALLIHTLLMASFPFTLPEHSHHPVSVRVQLVPTGSEPATESAVNQPSRQVQNQPFTVEQPTKPLSPLEPVTTQTRKRPTLPKLATGDTLSSGQNRIRPEPEPKPRDKAAAGARASQPSAAGEKPSPQTERKEQELTLQSRSPSEKSSYLSLLVQTIARKAQIRKLDEIEKGQVLSVELELNLMSNGALIGARITRPSDNAGLDQRVYRAALAASPYPEPPASLAQQRRFRVEVRYKF